MVPALILNQLIKNDLDLFLLDTAVAAVGAGVALIYIRIDSLHRKLPGPLLHTCSLLHLPVEYQAFFVLKMIEIVLIFSDLQKSSYGPDFRAVVRPQALVRDFPSFLHF